MVLIHWVHDVYGSFLTFFGHLVSLTIGVIKGVIMIESNPFTRKYFSILLVPCACEGQNNIFSIRFAIVESENKDSWTWFLIQVLERIFNTKHDFIIIYDRQIGLLDTIPFVFSDAHYSYSYSHLAQNLG